MKIHVCPPLRCGSLQSTEMLVRMTRWCPSITSSIPSPSASGFLSVASTMPADASGSRRRKRQLRDARECGSY